VFKLIFWIVVIYLIYRYFKHKIHAKKTVYYSKSEETEGEITEMVFDENCKTYIQKKDAIKVVVNGREYYFCSKECAEEFFKKLSCKT